MSSGWLLIMLNALLFLMRMSCKLAHGFPTLPLQTNPVSSSTVAACQPKSFLCDKACHCVPHAAPLIFPKRPFRTCAHLFPFADVLDAIIAREPWQLAWTQRSVVFSESHMWQLDSCECVCVCVCVCVCSWGRAVSGAFVGAWGRNKELEEVTRCQCPPDSAVQGPNPRPQLDVQGLKKNVPPG